MDDFYPGPMEVRQMGLGARSSGFDDSNARFDDRSVNRVRNIGLILGQSSPAPWVRGRAHEQGQSFRISVIDGLPQRWLPGHRRDGYWNLTGGSRMRIGPPSSASSFQLWGRRLSIQDLALVEAGCDPCDGMREKRMAARTNDLHLGVTVLPPGPRNSVCGRHHDRPPPSDALVWRSDQPVRHHSSSRPSSSRCPHRRR